LDEILKERKKSFSHISPQSHKKEKKVERTKTQSLMKKKMKENSCKTF